MKTLSRKFCYRLNYVLEENTSNMILSQQTNAPMILTGVSAGLQ